jgi:hypothetical protein
MRGYRTVYQVYQATNWLAHVLLSRFETAILDVDGNPHYARNDYRYRHDSPTLREHVIRWTAERAVRLDPRRMIWDDAAVVGGARPRQRERMHAD